MWLEVGGWRQGHLPPATGRLPPASSSCLPPPALQRPSATSTTSSHAHHCPPLQQEDAGWLELKMAGDRWLEAAGGRRQVAGGRWLEAGGWRQVAGGGGWRQLFWLVAGGMLVWLVVGCCDILRYGPVRSVRYVATESAIQTVRLAMHSGMQEK